MESSTQIKLFSNLSNRKEINPEKISKSNLKKFKSPNRIKSPEKTHSQSKISLSEMSKTTTTSLFSLEEIVFGQNALFIFGINNKIRITVQKIVFNKNFTLIIDILIMINSMLLVFETFTEYYKLNIYLNYIFTSLFTLEFILKIIAFGFVLERHTYLRDPWNWLDFFVVITGLIGFLPGFNTNMNSLRVFRLIRTLKTIKMFPNVKRFFNVIINSLIDLSAVLVMLFFFCLVFSILGLSLWSDRFNYLCRIINKPHHGKLSVNPEFNHTLCGGKNKCNNHPELCLSSIEYRSKKTYFMSKAFYWDDEVNNEYFNYGLSNFDNIFKSFFVVFLVITGEGWVKIMYLMIDGYSYYISVLYFVISVITNYFFMLKLTIAVLLYNFEKSRNIVFDLEQKIRERKSKKQFFKLSYQVKLFNQANIIKYKKKYPRIKIKKSQKSKIYNKTFCDLVKTLLPIQLFKYVPKKNLYHHNCFFGYICYLIYSQPFIQIFFFLAIIANAVILAFQSNSRSENIINNFEIINIIFLSIFVFEQFLLIFGLGLKEVFSKFLSILDFCIVSISVIEVFLKRNKSGAKTSTLSAFRILKIFRVIKLFRSWVQFNIIMESIKRTCYRMLDFFFLFIIFLYMYSLLGYSLFHNSLRFSLNGEYSAKRRSSKFNFDTFSQSLLSTFLIIIGDHWEDLFYQCYKSSYNNKLYVLVYFLTLVIFGQIILMNIFLSYLIDNFEKSCWELERNVYVRKAYLSYYFAPYRTFISENNEQKRIEKKENAENVFKEYLSLSKKLKLAKQGQLVLIGKSTINFITNKANIIEDYLVIHRYKKLKNIKEILFHKIFQDIKDISKIQEKKIEELNCYNFAIDYNEEYEEDKTIKRTKTYTPDPLYIKKNIEFILQNAYNPNNSLIPRRKTENRQLKTGIFNNQRLRLLEVNNHCDQIFHYILNDNVPKERIEKEVNEVKTNKNVFKKKLVKQKTLLNVKSKINILNDKIEEKPQKEKISLNFVIKPSLGVRIKEHMKHSSLFIFHKDWKSTKFIRKLTHSNEFNYIIFILIIISIIVLCFDNPWVRENSAEQKTIKYLNYFFNIIFLLEGLLKIISDGFIIKEKTDLKLNLKGTEVFETIIHELNDHSKNQNFEQISENDKIIAIQKVLNKLEKQKSYLLDPVNLIDFFCIIIGIIDIFSKSKNLSYLRALRAIRSIRPIRLLTQSTNLSLLLKCLLISIPALGNILLICLMYLFLFSIIGMNLFSSRGNGYCRGNKNFNREECLSSKGEWVYNNEHFDNFWSSLKNNFELMMGEDWAERMVLSYRMNGNELTYVFYIASIIIGNLFILNLIASVLIQKFRFLKFKKTSYPELDSYEIDWLQIQKIMMKYKPIQEYSINKKKTANWKKKLSEFVSSNLFKTIIDIIIVLSTIELMLQYNGASDEYNTMLKVFNILFTLCFTVEIVMKLLVSGRLFFKNRWNLFDFIITFLCDILAIIYIFNLFKAYDSHSISTFPLILRLFKILRVFRIISNFGILRNLFNTVMIMMPSIGNVGLIIGIIIVIYGNIGMNLFGTLPYRNSIIRTNNFRNFVSSSLVLFRVISGEDWNEIMNEVAYHDCRNKSSSEYLNDFYCYYYNVTCYDNYKINYTNIDLINSKQIEVDDPDNNELSYHYTCGNNFSYFYFITFVIITPVILLNLCIVMVVEGFSDSMHESESLINEDYMNKFIKLWIDYDPQCKLYILPHEFILIFKQLTPPFGINYDRHINYNPLKLEKNRHQHKIFCKYLKNDDDDDGENNINFNDVIFNNHFSNLPYGFQFKNFYVSKNKKFYTDDLEVLRILNKLDLVNYEGNSRIIEVKRSYTFENQIIGREENNKITLKNKKDSHNIHFVDACLALSRYAVATSQHIDYSKFREQLVNSYAINKWSKYFNAPQIFSLFSKRGTFNEDDNRICFKMSNKVLNRVNKIYNTKINDNPSLLKNNMFWKKDFNKKKKRGKLQLNDYMNVSNLPFLNTNHFNEENNNTSRIINPEQTFISMKNSMISDLSKKKTFKPGVKFSGLKSSNNSFLSPNRRRKEKKELSLTEKIRIEMKL